jgi:aspartyl/glutamyl-tRNA(Asn/Gln) amidotransferase C subunit
MKHPKYDIKKTAELAKIGLTKAEASRYGKELDSILEYVSKLTPISTDSVPPTDHATGNTMVSRPDEVRSTEPKAILEDAPAKAFRIPSVRDLWTS